ncbi:MAG: FHA domain-containing protein [Chloroflexi bacterium]|nr:FHA domain-containing protein [Chloroflexota bacterium]
MHNRETAMLILQESGGQAWMLDRPSTVIGRDDTCDVPLPDRVVSRRHAVIERNEDGYRIRDLESKNGTFVNGREVRGETPLQDGDEIQIALHFRLAFVDAGATAPLGMAPTQGQKPALTLDPSSRRVWVQGREVQPPLSPAQFRLLELLHDAAGQVVDREGVVEAVWAEESEAGVSEQAVDALVRRLRERLAELDPDWQYVVTVRGHGFRLDQRTD